MMKFEQVEALNIEDFSKVKLGKVFYVSTENVCVQRFATTIRIVDLNNALRQGTSCDEFSISATSGDLVDVKDVISRNYSADWLPVVIAEINNTQIGQGQSMLLNKSLRVRRTSRKSIRTFSPFVLSHYKRMRKLPNRWGLRHVARLLVNGQFSVFDCTAYYDDDVLNGFEGRYDEGEVVQPLHFVREIVEKPQGWNIHFAPMFNELTVSKDSYRDVRLVIDLKGGSTINI
ncbi:hypothetical protein [Aestuariispira insulae]|uniref:Uncharacterized protein n=1 Tax=Aestuariispira insulae TaxID=1461337 RepID=A0A3D9H3M5_9PROT|nr:hypothetical protein [Aestuariispira insulae]RED44108.1 hypothetical protein DFP90_11711 [Aestuariispira insulae]